MNMAITCSMTRLMTILTESDQIVLLVVAQSAPPLNLMDLKILHVPARLTTPAISLQDFAAMLEIKFMSDSHRPVPTLSNCEL